MENFLNPETILLTVGYAGIFGIVFLESGVFFGFFLPGDSLLFSAGFLASQGYFSILFVILGVFLSSVLGVIVGYLFGKRIGPKIFHREDFFFNTKNLKRTHDFYEKYGTWTITVSRFVPIVRTFAPILAGVGDMKWKSFLKYNFLGSAIWATVIPTAGYYFGREIPKLGDIVLPIMVLCFIVSFIPIFWGLYKYFKHKPARNASSIADAGGNKKVVTTFEQVTIAEEIVIETEDKKSN